VFFRQNLKAKSQGFGIDARVLANHDSYSGWALCWVKLRLTLGGFQDRIGDTHFVHG